MTIDMKSPPEATQQEQEQEQEQLPKETFFESLDLYKWQGFWYRPKHLKATAALRSHFQSKDDDVILASAMKTGSTWLKALCFTIMQTSGNNIINSVNDDNNNNNNNNYQVTAEKGEKKEDLLINRHPAHYVQTLEVQVYTATPPPDLSGMPSPRLFHTHLPLNALPECVKRSECKIVYIARNPKDTLLSMWHFFNTLRRPEEEGPYPLEDAFDKFCDGVCHFGPFLDHVLDYWNESLKAPEKVLFLKYEEMKRDPKKEVRRLAAFMGRPIGGDEEAEEVVRRCSLERLKNLEVNKNGTDPWVGMPNSSFFRTGIVGGWKDCLTAEMSERLDRIARSKLEGSGLRFEYGV